MTQSKNGKKCILFFEQVPNVGGSIINALYPLVAGLDREQYEPMVLFYWPNPYRERFEELGVKTVVFHKPKGQQHPTTIARFQKNKTVKSLQQSNGKVSNLYHNLGSYIRLSYYIPQILSLAKLMQNNNIDLIHLNGGPLWHSREAVLAAKLLGLPCVCYVMGFSTLWAADRQIARLIDQFAYCSNAIGQHYNTHGGVPPTKGRTIYHGIMESEKWAKSYNTGQIRQELGWSDQDFIVGNIGRLVSWKGQDVFLKALAEVKREAPDIKGLIVGTPDKEEGPNGQPASFYEELLALTKSLDLTDNVCFTGFRSDIPQLMASIDVLVHSSSEPEPFSTTVIEGMMAGRPVIVTNAGGMPEMIDEGVTGRLVPPNDSRTMAQAILSYYRNRTQAKQIGLVGQRKAKEQYTAQRNVSQFHTLYQTLLA